MVEREDLSEEGVIVETSITRRHSQNNWKGKTFQTGVQQMQRPCDRNTADLFKGQTEPIVAET